MSTNSSNRRPEMQEINDDEADQTHEHEEEYEQHCEMISHCSVPELETNIVIDILSRLPIKSLFNCRCVCKSWLSLISEPQFAKLHLSRSQISLLVSLLVKPDPRKYTSRKLHSVDLHIAPYTPARDARLKFVPKINLPKNPNIALNVVNSCNGFLCLRDESFNPIYVCNPILGEYIVLPECPDGANCSFDSSAFGFSSRTNQYKVIRFFSKRVFNTVMVPQSYEYEYEYEAKIYTLGEGLWRSLGKAPYVFDNSSFNTFVNEAIHWLAFGRSNPDLIRCFDFGSEEFRVVPEPSEFGLRVTHDLDYMRVGVIRGCLSICDFSDDDEVAVWVMKDYGVKESWSKDFVMLKMINEERCIETYEPIWIFKSGRILLLLNKDALLLYDPDQEIFENIHIYGIASNFIGIPYVPSLVSFRDVANGENLKVYVSKSK